MVDVEARVRMFRRRIASCIRGPNVILHLIPKIKELEDDVGNRLKLRLSSDDISAVPNPVDELIDIIIKSEQPGKWKAFCEALEESEYPHLVTLLTTNSEAIYSMDHEPKIIQLFAPAIVKRINAADIVSDLLANKIVNNDDKENILARHRTHGPTAAAILLLDRMQCRKSPKFWYPVFLQVLMQKHCADLVKDIDPDFYNCPSQYQPDMTGMPSDAMDVDMHSSSSCSPIKIAKMMCSDDVDCCASVDENIMTDHEDASMNDLSTPPRQDSQTSLLSDSTSMYYSLPMSMKKEVDEGNLCSQDTKLLTEKQLNIPLDVKSKHEEQQADSLSTKMPCGKMQPEHERKIKKNFKKLKQCIDAKHLTDTFIQGELFDFRDVERINGYNPNTQDSRNNEFFNILFKRGPRAYGLFLIALREQHMDLADLVESTKLTGDNRNTDSEDAAPMNDVSTQDSRTTLLHDSTSMHDSSPMSMKKEVDKGNLCSQDTKFFMNIQPDVKSKHEGKGDIKGSEDSDDDDDNLASDYEFSSDDEAGAARTPQFQLRNYQLELAEQALKRRNTVIFAETGSGKTFVALHIVQKHLQAQSLTQRKVVFMARTNVLIQQQAKRFMRLLPQFRTLLPTGDSEDSLLLGQLIPAYDIVCLTPQILINNLERGYISSVTVFSMLIFDECHHTQKGEPYNRLMLRYQEEKEERKNNRRDTDILPQVIGLTASLGVGKAHSDIEARDHILSICANLDVRHLSTVRKHREELMKHVNTPREEIVPLCKRNIDPCRVELLLAIADTEDKLQDFALLESDMIELMTNCPSEKNSQVYEKWTIDTEKRAQLHVDDSATSRNIGSCAKHLNVYCAALEVNHLLRAEDVVKYLADRFRVVGQQAHKLTDIEKELLAYLKNVLKNLVKHSRTAENPNLRFVSNTLRNMLKDKGEESRAMVFVQSRATCKALAKFLDKDLQSIGTRTMPLYGQDNRGDDDGMTEVEQCATMEKFNKGEVKVLVATSVGTEGIDVPNCDNVISYNYTGNEITKIQMSGRSRKKGGMTMVFGNESIVRRENVNAYKAHMMHRAMGLVQEMKQSDMERMIKKFQIEAMIKQKIQKELEQLKITQTDNNEYMLKCKRCTAFACNSSDIRQVSMFRFVTDKEFESRIEIRAHRKPEKIEGFEKRDKMYCKKCPMDWGIVCTYQGMPCHVLKIENFTLTNMQTGQANIPCKKWKNVPFTVPEITPEEISRFIPVRVLYVR